MNIRTGKNLPHFTSESTEVWKVNKTCPRSQRHTQKSRSLDPQTNDKNSSYRSPPHTGPLQTLSLILEQAVKEVYHCPHFTDKNIEVQRKQLAQGHLTGK